MDTINVTLGVPKEGKEIVDALSAILAHFMAKRPLAEIAGHLPAIMVAVDGYQKLGEEIGSDANDELAGYLVCKMFEALKVKPA